MNVAKVELKSIERIIAHEVQPKTEKKDAYAIAVPECSIELQIFKIYTKCQKKY